MIMILTADKATTASTAAAQITDKAATKADGDAAAITALTTAAPAREAHGETPRDAPATDKQEIITTVIQATTAIRERADTAAHQTWDADTEMIRATVLQPMGKVPAVKADQATEIPEWKAAVRPAIRADPATDKAAETMVRQTMAAEADAKAGMVHPATDRAVGTTAEAAQALAQEKEATEARVIMAAAQQHTDKAM